MHREMHHAMTELLTHGLVSVTSSTPRRIRLHKQLKKIVDEKIELLKLEQPELHEMVTSMVLLHYSCVSRSLVKAYCRSGKNSSRTMVANPCSWVSKNGLTPPLGKNFVTSSGLIFPGRMWRNRQVYAATAAYKREKANIELLYAVNPVPAQYGSVYTTFAFEVSC